MHITLLYNSFNISIRRENFSGSVTLFSSTNFLPVIIIFSISLLISLNV